MEPPSRGGGGRETRSRADRRADPRAEAGLGGATGSGQQVPPQWIGGSGRGTGEIDRSNRRLWQGDGPRRRRVWPGDPFEASAGGNQGPPAAGRGRTADRL